MYLPEAIVSRCRGVLDSLAQQPSTRFPRLPGSSEALLLLATSAGSGHHTLWVGDGQQALERMHRDLSSLAGDASPSLLYFPPGLAPGDTLSPPDTATAGHRLETLLALAAPDAAPRIILTSVQALLQKTLPVDRLNRQTVTVNVGSELSMHQLSTDLEKGGYEFTPQVDAPGQASSRGGLVDVWPLPETAPIRIEFDGDSIASIRRFGPFDQRSVGKLERVVIPPAREPASAATPEACLIDYLNPGFLLVWAPFHSAEVHAQLCEQAATETGRAASLITFSDLLRRFERAQPRAAWFTGNTDLADTVDPGFRSLPGLVESPRDALHPGILEGARQRLCDHIRRRQDEGYACYYFFDTRGAWDHIRNLLPPVPAAHVVHGRGMLSGGFECASLKLLLVAESDFFGQRRTLGERYDPARRRARPPPATGERLDSLGDIEPGDLVVHLHHGIGRYRGITEIVFNGQKQEVLTIEYAEQARLHVPVSQAHLLSRYVGVAHHSTSLHRLGGRRWAAEKAQAERSVQDLAASLLETQARRELLGGFAFQADTPWQHEFENAFPFIETQDQVRVIREIKVDMESTRPMDRLLCGDAGYGKTEVAMRAAFKAVAAGKQVAVLVPTTVLAQQHFETFTERMAAYPVHVEMLSRFCSRGRRPGILRELAEGRVDILIGTHTILEPGISFKDLGLVIIDEEQRFGVAHKERLKQMRYLVDVLTMTATPIPRTLYMSMTGARDISLLQTPPRDRVPIETLVTRVSDKVIREAILRELNRQGQVFYLYNRVMTIDWVWRHLRELVPEARIAVAHGQMAAGHLADVMRRFVGGEYDVLLSTTIIESGMDIPRANTILVDRADRFGIADLYQLRGRVGRSTHKAYAYLLLPSHGHIDPEAEERLAALRRYSDLGAGFNLALRDLEIRGAGNLLGHEQSGHIATVGFGLYCQLLKRSIARLKGDPLPPLVDVEVIVDFLDLSTGADPARSAVIPVDYIEDERLRLATYRRIAEISSPENGRELAREMEDRFGPIPPPLRRLLAVTRIRVLAHARRIQKVEARDDRLMLTRDNAYVQEKGRFPRLRHASPDQRLDEILSLVKKL